MRGSGISPRGSGAGGQGGAQPPHGGGHGTGRGGGGQSGLRLTDEAQASPHFTFTSIASPPIFIMLLSSIRNFPRSKKAEKAPAALRRDDYSGEFSFRERNFEIHYMSETRSVCDIYYFPLFEIVKRKVHINHYMRGFADTFFFTF